MDPQRGSIDISSSGTIGGLGPGLHKFELIVGDCVIEISRSLCCCSTEYDPSPTDWAACPHLTDGEDFSVTPLYVRSPGTSSSNDGAITLQIQSAKSPIQVSWTGPNGYSASSNSISNLGEGTYCFEVVDGCMQTETGCITLASCDSQDLGATVQVTNTCNGDSQGEILFEVSGQANPKVYERNQYGQGVRLVPQLADRQFIDEGLLSGQYHYIVINDTGCKFELDVFVGNDELVEVFDRKSCSVLSYCRDEVYAMVEYPVLTRRNSNHCWILEDLVWPPINQTFV